MASSDFWFYLMSLSSSFKWLHFQAQAHHKLKQDLNSHVIATTQTQVENFWFFLSELSFILGLSCRLSKAWFLGSLNFADSERKTYFIAVYVRLCWSSMANSNWSSRCLLYWAYCYLTYWVDLNLSRSH